jgi:regulator of sigma E protease
MLTTILLFLAVLSLLVLFHEWGHYITARLTGMDVEEFSIGFPPRLYSWKGKNGMKWTIGALPIGGFVKIKGESGEGDGAKDQDSFASKKVWQKLLVLVAGVTMNVVLAALLLGIGFMIGIPSIVEDGVPKLATVRDEAVRITEVMANVPASDKLKMGDTVIAINGTQLTGGVQARQILGEASGTVAMEIVRGDETQVVELEKAYIESLGTEGVGVGIATTGLVKYPVWYAPVKGVLSAFSLLGLIAVAFWDLIVGLVTGAGAGGAVAGPIGIAVATGEVASLGFVYLLQFAALLSLNLAILNILPIPALDGGRVIFVLYEAIFRKPANAKIEAALHNIGFLLLIALIIVVTYRDIITRI